MCLIARSSSIRESPESDGGDNTAEHSQFIHNQGGLTTEGMGTKQRELMMSEGINS